MCDLYANSNTVLGIPKRAIYIQNFISSDEENDILNHVYSAPIPKWTQLSNRKLQNYGGIPHAKGMIAEELPEWLKTYLKKITRLGAFPEDKPPNHVLVNEYLPGQGILPHLDGPLFYPTICTISCGSHTVLNFHPKQDDSEKADPKSIVTSLLLERRSLIIIQDDLYHHYPHSIDEKTEDCLSDGIANLPFCFFDKNEVLKRNTRVSLTIRHVPNTTKFKLKWSK